MAETHVIKLSSIVKFFIEEDKLITRGENALESGHVANMIFDEPMRILNGSIHASMRNKQYNTEIYFSSDWSIERALCSCPRGQYRCHHMAALALFGHYNISLTDKACSWTVQQPSKEDEIKKISDLYPSKNHKSTQRNLTEMEIENLRHRLQVYDGAVGFTWLLSKEIDSSKDQILIHIEDVIFSDEFNNASDQNKYFESKVKINQAKIMEVCEQTTGQNKNELWLVYRKNRITASNFGHILKAYGRNRFPPSLFKKLAGTYDIENLKAIQWGREHENEAIASFEKSTNLKVTTTGLWIHTCGYLGASPDGLINDNYIIEVKCPYKYRELSLLEGIKNNTSYIIISDSDGNIKVNKNHEYFYQIQGQLAITSRSMCYLVVWTPKETIVVTIDAEDFSHNIEILKEFYLNRFISFLIGKHVL